MKEIERNEIVLDEIFGHHDFEDSIKENLLIDWDKCFTCIFYNKKSDALKAKGEAVYDTIRDKNQQFIDWFKAQIEKMAK